MCSAHQDQTRGDLDSFTSAQHLKGYFWKAFAIIAVAHTNTGTALAVALMLKKMFDFT